MLEIYDFDFEQAVEEVSKLLDNKEYHKLKAYLNDLNPADIASLLAEIPEEKLPVVFRLLGKDLASETFVEMDPDGQETLIKSFSDKELKEIIDNLSSTTRLTSSKKCRPTSSGVSLPTPIRRRAKKSTKF